MAVLHYNGHNSGHSDKSVYLIINFLISQSGYICGDSFEHPKHMLKLIDKNIPKLYADSFAFLDL